MFLRRTVLATIASMALLVGSACVPSAGGSSGAPANGVPAGGNAGGANGNGNVPTSDNGPGAGPTSDPSTPGSTSPGTPPPTGPSQAGAAGVDPGIALFTANVAPVLQAKCSTAGCHGGAGSTPVKFAASTDRMMMYNVVTAYPEVSGTYDKSTAPILQHVLAGHFTTYTGAEQTAVGDWLDAEKGYRAMSSTSTVPAATPLTKILQAWSGCMDLATFQADNVATAFAQLTSNRGPCKQCHVNGEANMLATEDATRMFNILSSNVTYMQTYFVADLQNNKVVTNDDLFTKVGQATTPYTQHPTFTYANSTAMTALQKFYTDTMAKMTAGTCGPSKLKQP